MEMISYYAGVTLPMALLIFVGSYFGIWKKNEVKLPPNEVFGLFIFLWVFSAALTIGFHLALANQDELTRKMVANLWGPLIVGVIIGRNIVDWRRKINARKKMQKNT